MSGDRVNEIIEDIDNLRIEIDEMLKELFRNDEVSITKGIQDEGSIPDDFEYKLEKLKYDVKALKEIKKQQKKLEKLQEKKSEILREIETRRGREQRRREKSDKKRKK